MSFLIGIIIIAFVIGLLSREKGDNFLDTLSSGCGTIILIVVVIVIAIIVMAQNNLFIL
jgi:hypothetical protein